MALKTFVWKDGYKLVKSEDGVIDLWREHPNKAPDRVLTFTGLELCSVFAAMTPEGYEKTFPELRKLMGV